MDKPLVYESLYFILGIDLEQGKMFPVGYQPIPQSDFYQPGGNCITDKGNYVPFDVGEGIHCVELPKISILPSPSNTTNTALNLEFSSGCHEAG